MFFQEFLSCGCKISRHSQLESRHITPVKKEEVVTEIEFYLNVSYAKKEQVVTEIEFYLNVSYAKKEQVVTELSLI